MTASDAADRSFIRNLFRQPDKQKRAEATGTIACHGEAVVPDLIFLLDDEDWIIRYRAAETLGRIRSPVAVPDLLKTTSDPKDHVRYMAAKALGLIGDIRAGPAFLRLLTDDHPYSRGIAAEGIAGVGYIPALSSLQEACSREADAGIRRRMQDALVLLEKRENRVI